MDNSQVEEARQMFMEQMEQEMLIPTEQTLRIFDHKAGKSERTAFDRSHYDTGNADIVGWLIVISLLLLCIGAFGKG